MMHLCVFSQHQDTVWIDSQNIVKTNYLDYIIENIKQENKNILNEKFDEVEWNRFAAEHDTQDTLVREVLNFEDTRYLIMENKFEDRKPIAYINLINEGEKLMAILYEEYTNDGSYIESKVLFYIKITDTN